MNGRPSNYNLLVESWIPVLRTDGKYGRVGVREALTQAGRIRQIAASNPMDNVALLRLLLAVLQWCKPSLADQERDALEGAVGIPEDWVRGKLGPAHAPDARFELLADTGGFYQDSAAGGARVAVTNLLHDLPSASNVAHFRHLHDGRVGMCLACCALGLVRWPGVASAGTAGARQSMTASINGQRPAYSIPIGANLLYTLLLIWPSESAVRGDAPVWDGSSEQSPLGFLKGMTWRSRRVLLAPPDEEGKRGLSPGRCCHCGEQTDHLVRSVLFRPGWRRPSPSTEPWSEDPHLLQVAREDPRSAKGKQRQIVPSWPSPNDPLEDHAGVWRAVLQGLLQRSLSSQTGATSFHTTLLGSSQQLYKHVGTHTATLPELGPDATRLLLEELEWLRQVTWVTTAARAGNWRDSPKGHRIVGALSAQGAKGHAIRSALCAVSPLAQSELEETFRKLMEDLAVADRTDSSARAAVLASWRDQARDILRRQAGQAAGTTTPGSPLRQREAAQRARHAVDQVMADLVKAGAGQPAADAAGQPKRGRRKGGRA